MSRLGPALSQALRYARPATFAAELRRVASKWRRRRAGVESRVVHLEPQGEPRGDVLVAYVIDAVLDMASPLPVTHTHFWETRQIVQTFLDLGYRVDVVHWTNTAFVPRKPYRLALDVRLNLHRWAEQLPAETVRVFHGETSHASFHDPAQRARLADLATRRGIRLPPRKSLGGTPAYAAAHAATLLGDETTAATYRAVAPVPLYEVPISAPAAYPDWPRDLGRARRRFLWLGSDGFVHKGLDLVLEAFAGLPDHQLTVCGPIAREREFERAFWRELYRTPNITTQGWIDVTGDDFARLARESLGLVYPSCSEGQCGSVVTCLHAGLVPVVSDRTGVPIDPAWGVVVPRPTVEGLRRAVVELAGRDDATLREMSVGGRAYARGHHTRERFATAYRAAAEAILERFGAGG